LTFLPSDPYNSVSLDMLGAKGGLKGTVRSDPERIADGDASHVNRLALRREAGRSADEEEAL